MQKIDKLPWGVNRKSYVFTGIPPHTDPRATGPQADKEAWLRDRNRARKEMKLRIRQTRELAKLRRKQER